MESRERLRKVKQLHIRTRRLVNAYLVGHYHSAFKGRGIEFQEVRSYEAGDAVQDIDWKVTARMGAPYIKTHREERELLVMLLVDVSASGYFGSANQRKMDLATEVAAMLAISATRNQDKAGLILFSESIEKFIPPRKGSGHILRLIRELLFHRPSGRKTNLPKALQFLNRIAPKRTVCFLLSDFWDEFPSAALRVSAQRHDLIAIEIADAREREIPASGLVVLEDLESGETHFLDSSCPAVRQSLLANYSLRQESLRKTMSSLPIGHIRLTTSEDPIARLLHFFRHR